MNMESQPNFFVLVEVREGPEVKIKVKWYCREREFYEATFTLDISATACRTSAVTASQSPAASAALGVSQDPPTQATLGSAR